jgi:hypothetical protein
MGLEDLSALLRVDLDESPNRSVTSVMVFPYGV